jgi:hypothetical protein
MPWPPRRSTTHELDLQREVTTLQLKLLRTNSALQIKTRYAERLEFLLRERLTKIDELTGTIETLRQRNQKLNLENDCLTAMIAAPPRSDFAAQSEAAMLAPAK